MKTSTNMLKPVLGITAALLVATFAGCGGSSTSVAPATNLPVVVAPTVPGAGTGLAGLGKGPAPVVLGAAGNYVILAKSAISTVPTSAITGNLGLSPAAASFITGFTLVADPTNVFATSTQVTGQVFAANYAVPTPSNLGTAVLNMGTAYTDAAGRAADYTELGAGNIGGMTIVPGTYQWSSNVLIPTDVTLNGGPNDVWIFQIAGGITQANAAKVILTGGALPKNVFWQTFGAVSVGTTAHMEGVILSQTSITLKTGASANSRLLAQTAVTLQSNAVTQPAP
ncbi:MAG: ice-binding family protein [Gallionella sp.]